MPRRCRLARGQHRVLRAGFPTRMKGELVIPGHAVVTQEHRHGESAQRQQHRRPGTHRGGRSPEQCGGEREKEEAIGRVRYVVPGPRRVGWTRATTIAAPATKPRKPNTRSRQVALLAASHQITKSRQLNRARKPPPSSIARPCPAGSPGQTVPPASAVRGEPPARPGAGGTVWGRHPGHRVWPPMRPASSC